MKNFLINRVEETPNLLGLAFEDRKWTFAELFEESQQYAHKIADLGIYEGSKVGVIPNNTPESVFVIHALMLLGVEIVLLNARLTDKELNWQVKRACVRAIFTYEYRDLENAIVLTFDTLNKFEAADEIHMRKTFEENDTATIMFTSGTTGNPKAVIQTYGNHYHSAMLSCNHLGVGERDKWLCFLPLYHISGLSILMRSLIVGVSVQLTEQFEVETVNRAIVEDGVTIASVVSSTLSRMLADGIKYPCEFKGVLLGGGPAPMPLLEQCVNMNIAVFQTYGMTETCSQFTTLAPEEASRKIGSAGKPIGDNQIKVAAPMESAEIFVRGPVVTPGYFDGEAADTFEEGWFATGDYGYLDEEGFLFVQDRRSDLIISGGENIYPAEIESALLAHPSVLDAGVIGVSDERWGSVPNAFVVVNTIVSEEDLILHCAKILAKYKIPKNIYLVEELPRTASGKLLRRELSKELL